MKDGEEEKNLLSISFAKMLLSKIYLKLLQKDKAKIYVNEAVTTMRKANARDHLPKVLLTRAFVYLKTYNDREDLDLIESDLDEVKDIIDYGNMRLYEKEYNELYEEFKDKREWALSYFFATIKYNSPKNLYKRGKLWQRSVI